jgi:hypothetical protein
VRTYVRVAGDRLWRLQGVPRNGGPRDGARGGWRRAAAVWTSAAANLPPCSVSQRARSPSPSQSRPSSLMALRRPPPNRSPGRGHMGAARSPPTAWPRSRPTAPAPVVITPVAMAWSYVALCCVATAVVMRRGNRSTSSRACSGSSASPRPPVATAPVAPHRTPASRPEKTSRPRARPVRLRRVPCLRPGCAPQLRRQAFIAPLPATSTRAGARACPSGTDRCRRRHVVCPSRSLRSRGSGET